MKQLFTVFVLLHAFLSSYSQFKWTPRWQKGQVEKLEYVYSKIEYQHDSLTVFDTAHSFIQVIYLYEDDSNYIFQWQFNKTYINTSSSEQHAAVRLTSELLSKAAQRCPIKFAMHKSDFAIHIINHSEIDSEIDLAKEEINKEYGKKQRTDSVDIGKFFYYSVMSYSRKFDYTFLTIIKEYYRIYKKHDLVPNVKLNLPKGDVGQGPNDEIVLPNSEGYTFFDTASEQYHWKFQSKTDMAKLFEMAMNKLNGKTTSDSDESYSINGKDSSAADMNIEINVSKPYMQVSLDKLVKKYYKVTSGVTMKSSEILIIKSIE